ncbi:Protein of unknown function [Bacillus cytotoxicus]|uniref:Uncharacterized protein n=1 Tax=Bacillus cytotoxicus TaxID=580165 RepID=A0AAX2CFN9_9BACI|nr:Protein of unknown function [Bacillus cytotoxicus]SCN34617.1 Protein of unknown function [Bacillus cytotoxicus]
MILPTCLIAGYYFPIEVMPTTVKK